MQEFDAGKLCGEGSTALTSTNNLKSLARSVESLRQAPGSGSQLSPIFNRPTVIRRASDGTRRYSCPSGDVGAAVPLISGGITPGKVAGFVEGCDVAISSRYRGLITWVWPLGGVARAKPRTAECQPRLRT